MEIYPDNVAEKGIRPRVPACRLAAGPWAIDSHGRIATRIGGALSACNLERALAAAVEC